MLKVDKYYGKIGMNRIVLMDSRVLRIKEKQLQF